MYNVMLCYFIVLARFKTWSSNNLPSLDAVISMCIVSDSASLAANALNTVASVSVPLASRAFAVRPCSVKLPCVVSMSVYSPRPLKVYWKPSRVRMCGSP